MVDIDTLIDVQAASFERAGPGLRASWPPESAMSATELGAFFDAHNYCILATTSSAGRPLARPVAYAVVGASVWLPTVEGVRLRNMKRIPWVSLVISEGDRGQHQAVVIDGSVGVVDSPPAKIRDAWAARHGAEANWADAWAEVHPARLLSYVARNHR